MYGSWVKCCIAFFLQVYKLTGYASLLWFKSYYNKLTAKQKMEWNNRGFSTFHAIFAALLSLYLVLLSDLFKDDDQDVMMIDKYSVLSNSVLGVSVGYFLTDLAMIVWCYPVLGGVEYLLHHGLSLFSIILAILSGNAQIYILMVLFTECTTPFVNLRWYLDVAGQKTSKLYIYNGVMLFLGWLVARILLFVYFFVHMYNHFDQVRTIFPLGFYTVVTVPPTMSMMNVVWFWKIAKGMVKTVSRARKGHSRTQ
ncbi:TLC domain-containing protein 4 [Linum grandiflorum]